MAKIVKFTETGRADGDKRPLYIRPDRIDATGPNIHGAGTVIYMKHDWVIVEESIEYVVNVMKEAE